MATTGAPVAPVADERPPAADVAEVAAAEGNKRVEAAAEVGGGGDGEEVRFEGKDRSSRGSEVNNGVVGAEDREEVEAAAGDEKDESEGEVEAAAPAAKESGAQESAVEDVKAASLTQAPVAVLPIPPPKCVDLWRIEGEGPDLHLHRADFHFPLIHLRDLISRVSFVLP